MAGGSSRQAMFAVPVRVLQIGRKPVTESLVGLIGPHPEVGGMLEASIAKAQEDQPGRQYESGSEPGRLLRFYRQLVRADFAADSG